MIDNYDPSIVEEIKAKLLKEQQEDKEFYRQGNYTPFALKVGNYSWIYSDSVGDIKVLGGYKEFILFVSALFPFISKSTLISPWILRSVDNYLDLSQKKIELLTNPDAVIRTDREFIKRLQG